MVIGRGATPHAVSSFDMRRQNWSNSDESFLDGFERCRRIVKFSQGELSELADGVVDGDDDLLTEVVVGVVDRPVSTGRNAAERCPFDERQCGFQRCCSLLGGLVACEAAVCWKRIQSQPTALVVARRPLSAAGRWSMPVTGSVPRPRSCGAPSLCHQLAGSSHGHRLQAVRCAPVRWSGCPSTLPIETPGPSRRGHGRARPHAPHVRSRSAPVPRRPAQAAAGAGSRSKNGIVRSPTTGALMTTRSSNTAASSGWSAFASHGRSSSAGAHRRDAPPGDGEGRRRGEPGGEIIEWHLHTPWRSRRLRTRRPYPRRRAGSNR